MIRLLAVSGNSCLAMRLLTVFLTIYSGQFILSTQLIKSMYLVIPLTDAAPQFLWKLTPLDR